MALSPDQFAKLNDLLGNLRDGTLDDAQFVALDQMLCNDPDAADYYAQYVMLCVELSKYHAVPSQSELFEDEPSTRKLLAEVLEQQQAAAARDAAEQARLAAKREAEAEAAAEAQARREEAERLAEESRPRVYHIVIPKSLAYGVAIAALLLLSTMISLPPTPPTPEPSAPTGAAKAEPIATVVHTLEAQWADDQQYAASDGLLRGHYELLDGLVLIEFASGARATVEGPAIFSLDGDNAARLVQGRLVGHCPPGTEGLTIQTSGAQVIDLGTEFGVAIEDDGDAEIHVFDGSVSVQPSGSGVARQTLLANNAARADARGWSLQAIKTDSLAFVRHREFEARVKANEGSRYHRWLAYAYELRRDPKLVAFYDFATDNTASVPNLAQATAGQLDATSVGANGAQATLPTAPGRWSEKPGLAFSRSNQRHLMIPHSPLLDLDELTIAVWVRRRGAEAPQGVIVSKRNHDNVAFQFGILGKEPDQGHMQFVSDLPAGADAAVARTTRERVGQEGWDHLVVTFDGERAVFYRNGTYVEEKAIAAMSPNAADLIIGMSGRRDEPAAFEGVLDELAIFSYAANAQQVSNMFESGRP
ncbi:MAG: LamG-like jellyroll fold domain-containing protein [Phycisphaeraceae bacterium]